MIPLWVGFCVLALCAFGFVIWPLIKFGRHEHHLAAGDVADRLAENIRLFKEHVAELEGQLAAGRLDGAQFAQLKLEHERALLSDEQNLQQSQQASVIKFGVVSFILIGGLLIGTAYWLYGNIGASADVELKQLIQQKHQLDAEDINQGRNIDTRRGLDLIKALESRLRDEPKNLQYWFFLARTAMESNDFAKAVTAYQQVLALDTESAMVMAELAQAMFLRDGSVISPPISDLANKSLIRDPNNTMALGLAGMSAFHSKDYPSAIKLWQRLVSAIGPNTPEAQNIEAGIDRALTLYAASGGDTTSLTAAINGREIRVQVSLGEGVMADPEQLVYVYARAWQGPKMPLAITRIKVSDLPAQILLTEAMAMSPAMSLAQAEQVELVARISQDGGANAKPGDWQGKMGPVDMSAVPNDLRIQIDHKVTE